MSRPVVLITGAAKRAGREFALYFARHGYEVIVHHGASIDDAAETVELIGQEGGHACALKADLQDAHAIEQLLARVFERFGRLDLLVNNASVFWQGGERQAVCPVYRQTSWPVGRGDCRVM